MKGHSSEEALQKETANCHSVPFAVYSSACLSV